VIIGAGGARTPIKYGMAFRSAMCEGRPHPEAELAKIISVVRSVIGRWRREHGFGAVVDRRSS
jgi:hypothetical protein